MPLAISFEQPPVREVELTVFIKAIEGLQVSHLAHVLHSWQEEFPKTDELPPISPWQQESNEVAFLSSRAKWPFPTLWLGQDKGTRSIRVHHDRLALTWSFDEQLGGESSSYPGYQVLKDDLRERFALFSVAVSEGTGEQAIPLRVETRYLNQVNTDDAWKIARRLLGLEVSESGLTWLDSISYAGLRVHRRSDASAYLISGLDVDLEEPDPADVQFRIISALSVGDDTDMWDSLDEAHDSLIEEFLRSTDPNMHRDWGRR